MSEHVRTIEHSPEASHATATAEVPFNERQIEQFDADDGDAARAIGKMLASFFLYTVIVMSLVAWWTLGRRGSGPNANATAPAAETHSADVEGESAEPAH